MSKIDQISHEVDEERARFAQSLGALASSIRPERLVDEATHAASSIGNDLTQKAWSTLRDNPAGGILVSLGLGLLASGQTARTGPGRRPQPIMKNPNDALVGFDERVAEADAEMRSQMNGQLENTQQAAHMRAALDRGLDKLPPKARQRVIKARRAAIGIQEEVEKQARRAARKTSGFVQDQPLTAGAIALGFGVIAGALLPSTRREDELLGARRDALMAEARSVLEEELLNAKHKAEAALSKRTAKPESTIHAVD